MQPKKQAIVDALVDEYYPHIVQARQSLLRGGPLVDVPCHYPAVFILTKSIKVYRAMVLPSADSSDKDAEPLRTEQTTVIPARYICIQCEQSFESLRRFREHFITAESYRLANAPQQSLVK